MIIEVLRSKIHRVRVNQLELHYNGSITIDTQLLRAAQMIPNEKVHVLNVNNGARFETYIIEGPADSGIIGLNGPAARMAALGDMLIVISYGQLDFEAAKTHTPIIIIPDENNRLPDA
jgi:aspartate 1-decarboxylase